MTTQNVDYYRQRADEELAAAERPVNPAIAQIHREMASRYRDLMNGHVDGMNGHSAQPAGTADAEPRPAFG